MTNTIKMPKNGIKITKENKRIIDALLNDVNGKAYEWVVHSYETIEDIANRAELKLNKTRLTKKQKNGVEAVMCGYAPSANSYKYAVTTTYIRLKRYSDGWRLTDVFKSSMYPKDKDSNEVYLKVSKDMVEEIKRRAVEAAVKNIIVGQ